MSLISCQCCRTRSDFCLGVYSLAEMMEGSRLPQRLLFPIREQREEDDRYSHMANKTVGKHLISCYWFLWMEGSPLRRWTLWSVVSCASRWQDIKLYQPAIRENVFLCLRECVQSVRAAYVYAVIGSTCWRLLMENIPRFAHSQNRSRNHFFASSCVQRGRPSSTLTHFLKSKEDDKSW